jgi:hypothetical protein
VRPDGSRVVVPFVPATRPNVDCFYVYPTLDMAMVPGNHTDFTDTTRMRDAARAQAARFGAACRVIVPLYRQITFDTYLVPREEREPRLKAAFADVLDAFRWYLAHLDDGRRIVLIGHSQGAEMVVRLLLALFDGDARARGSSRCPSAASRWRRKRHGRHVPEHPVHLCRGARLHRGVQHVSRPRRGAPLPDPPAASVAPPGQSGRCGQRRGTSSGRFPSIHPTRAGVFAHTGETTPSSCSATYSVWCVDRADGAPRWATSGPGDVREPGGLSRSIWRRDWAPCTDLQFAQEIWSIRRAKAAIAGRQTLP